MTRLKWLLAGLGTLAVLVLLAGRAGLLGGQPPPGLGVHDGRLKAPSTSPNSVSSQADLWPGHPQQATALIAPLPASGAAAMARLQTVVAAMPGARIAASRPDYLYVQFTSQWLKFVDDTEFWLDPAAGVIQVRSASRLGESDLGVNRARIEALRARLAAP
jgi:uncharacterized protein (DUF1499 family)